MSAYGVSFSPRRGAGAAGREEERRDEREGGERALQIAVGCQIVLISVKPRDVVEALHLGRKPGGADRRFAHPRPFEVLRAHPLEFGGELAVEADRIERVDAM